MKAGNVALVGRLALGFADAGFFQVLLGDAIGDLLLPRDLFLVLPASLSVSTSVSPIP